METPIVRVFRKEGDLLFYDENKFKEFSKNQIHWRWDLNLDGSTQILKHLIEWRNPYSLKEMHQFG